MRRQSYWVPLVADMAVARLAAASCAVAQTGRTAAADGRAGLLEQLEALHRDLAAYNAAGPEYQAAMRERMSAAVTKISAEGRTPLPGHAAGRRDDAAGASRPRDGRGCERTAPVSSR